jgi:ankyrin repeat protein
VSPQAGLFVQNTDRQGRLGLGDLDANAKKYQRARSEGNDPASSSLSFSFPDYVAYWRNPIVSLPIFSARSNPILGYLVTLWLIDIERLKYMNVKFLTSLFRKIDECVTLGMQDHQMAKKSSHTPVNKVRIFTM